MTVVTLDVTLVENNPFINELLCLSVAIVRKDDTVVANFTDATDSSATECQEIAGLRIIENVELLLRQNDLTQTTTLPTLLSDGVSL